MKKRMIANYIDTYLTLDGVPNALNSIERKIRDVLKEYIFNEVTISDLHYLNKCSRYKIVAEYKDKKINEDVGSILRIGYVYFELNKVKVWIHDTKTSHTLMVGIFNTLDLLNNVYGYNIEPSKKELEESKTIFNEIAEIIANNEYK